MDFISLIVIEKPRLSSVKWHINISLTTNLFNNIFFQEIIQIKETVFNCSNSWENVIYNKPLSISNNVAQQLFWITWTNWTQIII